MWQGKEIADSIQVMGFNQHAYSMMSDLRCDQGAEDGSHRACDSAVRSSAGVIVNADDWGSDIATTNQTLDCVLLGAVSSVSAMVFMEDSERAAQLAMEHGIDAGLHLNLTTPLHAQRSSLKLREHQKKLSRFLRAHSLAFLLYHPGLTNSFEYAVKAQLEEFERLFGAPAKRVDGHHHMHLSTNIVLQELLPSNLIVRRNFTFGPGEKGYFNRLYRRRIDRRMARRHRMTDFFFDLRPLEPSRIARIVGLAAHASVEVETHPARQDEYSFLMEGELFRCAADIGVAQGYVLPELQQERLDHREHSKAGAAVPMPPPVSRQ